VKYIPPLALLILEAAFIFSGLKDGMLYATVCFTGLMVCWFVQADRRS
jgi:hypothetical protein